MSDCAFVNGVLKTTLTYCARSKPRRKESWLVGRVKIILLVLAIKQTDNRKSLFELETSIEIGFQWEEMDKPRNATNQTRNSI